MGEKDTITKNYMQDKTIFADAFNFLLYNGEQVVDPKRLKQIDTTSLVLPYGEDDKPVPIQKFRDVLKVLSAMEDDNAAYLILGIENQSELHYAMPVKNMLYDAIQYSMQVSDAAKSHKKHKSNPETNSEFLSGFYRTDKLVPVITLTVYFGADEWTAPRDLHSMLAADKKILNFIDNYHIHLIAPSELNDNDFSKFHSELSLALKYVKYSKDKNQFLKMVKEDTAFKSVSKATADVINAVTGYDVKIVSDEGGNVDMCEAIEGIKKDAKEEGKAEGMLEILCGLINDGILTIADAAARANMSVPEFIKKTGLKV